MSSESVKSDKKESHDFSENGDWETPMDRDISDSQEHPKASVSLAAIFAGLIVIAMLGSYLAFLAEADKDRDLASAYDITESITPILDSAKMLAPLQIRLDHGTIPEDAESDLQIDANISTSMTTLPEVSYEWQFPEGVHLVAGLENDELTGLKGGQPIKISIVVSGFSKQKSKIISFHAHTETGKNRLSQSALLTSRPEDYAESNAQEKMKAVRKSENGKRN